MRFNYHFYFLSYHQRNAMIVHRAGNKILMQEMAEGTTTIYHICVTVSFMIQFLKSFKSAGSSSTHSCFKISSCLVHRWLYNVLILSSHCRVLLSVLAIYICIRLVELKSTKMAYGPLGNSKTSSEEQRKKFRSTKTRNICS